MRRSPILEKLADLYATSTAGKTGRTERDFGIAYFDLLEKAHCTSGEAHALAEHDLQLADGSALVITRHRRDHYPRRIRVPLAMESALFERVGRESPTALRHRWAALFAEAATWSVPEKYRATWSDFCQQRITLAHSGTCRAPFRPSRFLRARLQLQITAALLAWEHPCLLRTASVRLTGHSKTLERSQATFETLLGLSTASSLQSFADLGIEHNPGTVRFHGPIRLGKMDFSSILGESALSASDLASGPLQTDALRCITVENATKFHELCRLPCGDLFVFTSYPNEATVRFLRALPEHVALHHFGDTDPWGFDVLLRLRQLTARPVYPLHMRYRILPDSPHLDARAQRKLTALLAAPHLADVHPELLHLQTHGCLGDYEQESLLLDLPVFPYLK